MNQQLVEQQIKKSAIILFNLGGPNKKTTVEQFLFNLFYDKAIITLPNPFRWLIAKGISYFRAKSSQKNYDLIGGHSPILDNTEQQADLLTNNLLARNYDVKTFVSMRYSYPQTNDIIDSLKDYAPDELILLPLYPQFSTTTSESSITEFNQIIRQHLPNIKTKNICCFFEEPKFITTQVELIIEATKKTDTTQTILIFSAHGLPQKIIDNGDPYQWQVEQTVDKILQQLPIKFKQTVITYQSRVGPIEWLKPYTDEEIVRFAKQKSSIMIVPIAFISEHLETLVELDIEYRELAEQHGAKEYTRVATPSFKPIFIDSLAEIVIRRIDDAEDKTLSCQMTKACLSKFGKCISDGYRKEQSNKEIA